MRRPNQDALVHFPLDIQQYAEIPLRKWTWTAQRIHAGENGVCETLAHNEDTTILVEEVNPYQVCITPGEDGILNTTEDNNEIDDEIGTFEFVYTEEEWLTGTGWHWKLNQCALLEEGCPNE